MLGLALLIGLGVGVRVTMSDDSAILAYPDAVAPPTMAPFPRPDVARADATEIPIATIRDSWQIAAPLGGLAEHTPRWVVEDDLLRQDGMGRTRILSPDLTLILSPARYTNVTLTASFYDTGNGTVGLVVRASDRGHYRVRLHTDPTFDGEALVVEKVTDGVAVPVVTIQGEPLYQRHTWNTLAFSARGETLTVTLNGRVVSEVVDAAPLPAGRVGLLTRALGGIGFSRVALDGEEVP